jgi:hypothetical protein
MPTQKLFTSGPNIGRKVYAKIRVADQAVLSLNAPWPTSTDDEPIVGDDGSIKFLPIEEDANDTVYDSDRYFVETSNLIEPTRYYVKRSIVERPAEELKLRALNYAKANDNTLVPIADIGHPLAISVAALARKSMGLTLTDIEEAALAEVAEKASGLVANKARLEEVEKAIDESKNFDMKAGWSKKESTLPFGTP